MTDLSKLADWAEEHARICRDVSDPEHEDYTPEHAGIARSYLRLAHYAAEQQARAEAAEATQLTDRHRDFALPHMRALRNAIAENLLERLGLPPSDDSLINAPAKAAKRLAEQQAEIERLAECPDDWREASQAAQENGICGCCFAPDERGHEPGCYAGELEADAERLRKVARKIEWNADCEAAHCPCCWNIKRQGHRLDCELAAALGEAENSADST